MQERQNRTQLRTYILICILIFVVILLNLHNDNYNNLIAADSLIAQHESPNSYGRYIDELPGYKGEFARTGWFYVPTAGAYTLTYSATTYTEGQAIEVYGSDGRSEELLLNEPIPLAQELSVIRFRLAPDVKYIDIRYHFGGEGYLLVRDLYLRNPVAFTDTYLTAGLFLLSSIALGYYLFFKKKQPLVPETRETALHLLILLLAVVFISQPTFLGYLFQSHDGVFHLSRVESLKDALLAGIFPVRNYPSAVGGYGYAAPLYYADLFLLFPAFLRILGTSQAYAINSFVVLLNLATAAITYFCAKRMLRDGWTALFTSLLYTTLLYRLINLYMRGAYGESIATTFFPLVILGLYEIFFGDQKKWWFALIGYTGVIQSHVISTLLVALFSILYALVFLRRLFSQKRFFTLAKMLGGTLLVNLWFLVPLLQMYTLVDTNFAEQTVTSYKQALYLSQAMDVFVNASGQSNGLWYAGGEMGFSLGLPITLGVGLFLYAIAARKDRASGHTEKIALVALLFGAIALWVSTYHFPMKAVAAFGWFGKLLNSIQFPWRLLTISGICFSIVGAVGAAKFSDSESSRKIFGLLLAVVIAVPAGHFLYSVINLSEGIPRGVPAIDHLGRYMEYLPTGFDYEVLQQREPGLSFADPGATLRSYQNTNKQLVFSYADATGEIELPLIAYPGYQAVDDSGNKLPLSMNEHFLLSLTPKNPEGTITVRFVGFPLWSVCDLVSLVTVALLLLVPFLKRSRTRNQTATSAGH